MIEDLDAEVADLSYRMKNRLLWKRLVNDPALADNDGDDFDDDDVDDDDDDDDDDGDDDDDSDDDDDGDDNDDGDDDDDDGSQCKVISTLFQK